MRGKLYLVGIGPGSLEHMTYAARKAIEESQVIIGYRVYIDWLVRDPTGSSLLAGKQLICKEITEEVIRARLAIEKACEGNIVALISGGDVGIYAMAGLVFEVLSGQKEGKTTLPSIEVIPGVTAAQAAASLLGAPLMHDFACISLSDLLTPWDQIALRLQATAQADFVICLYNPQSRQRTWQIQEARRILLNYKSPETPVGIVKNAYRDGQQVIVTTLEKMTHYPIDMSTVLIIGNRSTFVLGEWLVTPRRFPGPSRGDHPS
jgi:precorrin-3B C17-methyltransferase